MSYNVHPPRITDLGLPTPPSDAAGHVHDFAETRVVIALGLRFQIRICVCGRVTSNGIPGWADQVRVLQVSGG